MTYYFRLLTIILQVIRFDSANTNFSSHDVIVNDVISVSMSTGWNGKHSFKKPIKYSLKNSISNAKSVRIPLNDTFQDCIDFPCKSIATGFVLINLKNIKSDILNIQLTSHDLENVTDLVMDLYEIKPMSSNKLLKTKIVGIKSKLHCRIQQHNQTLLDFILENTTSVSNRIWSIVLKDLDTKYDMFNFTIEAVMLSDCPIAFDVLTYGSQCLSWDNTNWSNEQCKVILRNKY